MRFTVLVRTKFHCVTLAILLLGAVSRIVAWQPSLTASAVPNFGRYLFVYSVLLASYAVLAVVVWFTRRFHSFSFALAIGSAANVAFGIYRDYGHFIHWNQSWYSGLDAFDAIAQIILVLGGLLLAAFFYGLFSGFHNRA